MYLFVMDSIDYYYDTFIISMYNTFVRLFSEINKKFQATLSYLTFNIIYAFKIDTFIFKLSGEFDQSGQRDLCLFDFNWFSLV